MVIETQAAKKCSACGTPLSREPWSEGLCPSCVFSLALGDSAVEADLLAEAGEAPTLQFTPDQAFSEGEIQGDRYRIRSLLGRGGMGEVWRAYDLKLRQDVALKALRTELIADKHALETLRQEVRTAREVISPNVCRVFDLQEVDGQELVAMEYVDGTTLQEILKERGPLELNEAREIATQFLAGLEAIHEAGLIHRDIKPENVMVTRTGRVVVMDFGIAKGLGEGRGGLVAGTPAYMSPEQSAGDELDARADLFSAGVVLAEMVEPGGMGTFEDRRKLWEGIHQAEPQITDTPWSKVIAKAVSAETRDRFESASALARALEEVTLRAAGDETARPYPGLSAFQEEDARFFFGRELEVEALWKKLRRPHLLAVIGPSGAGKSSFLRAGLLPTLTDGWRAIITTPGNRPFDHLARALETEIGDAPGVSDLLDRIEEPGVAVELLGQWRRQAKHALLIVDQFEELFTQNPEDIQQRFSELLGRLPLEADLFVLLSMRDDFLFHCHRFDAFQPILSDLTLLGPPTGAALRRALVEPALRCGYRFEEESIVEEMLSEVEGERGALPMVAFTAAQLWEQRDRDTGYLTKEAYEAIGGVGGALAQHAEQTLEQIGDDGIPIVRELFRNLVTAQGTRAARDREELLSVFGPDSDVGAPLVGAREGASPSPTSTSLSPATGRRSSGERGAWSGEATEPEGPAPFAGERVVAARVLDTLVDARLLTSYEVPGDNEEIHHHRIEIVHESLLKAWPRLVRWQMQDAEGAKLREELRAQARLWNEHDRSVDYLWTGTAFKEYELWRERYPGGLTTIEEEFARAMTAHAERRRRRRRVALGVVLSGLLAVLAIVTWSRFEAVAEARRAEAAKLLAVAQLQLEEDPTEALAYATASLELADTEPGRVLAVRALSVGPPARVLDGLDKGARLLAFSEDGRWLATAGFAEEVLVFQRDGTGPVRLPGHNTSPSNVVAVWCQNRYLITAHWTENRVRIWSFPGGELVRQIDFGAGTWMWWVVNDDHLVAQVPDTDVETGHELLHLRAWGLPDGEVQELGTVDWTALGGSFSWFSLEGSGWFYGKGNEIFLRPLPVRQGVADRLVGRHDNEAHWWPGLLPTEPNRLWTRDASSGELRQWDLSISNGQPLRVIPRPADATEEMWLSPDAGGRWVMDASMTDSTVKLWDFEALPGSRGLELRRRASWYGSLVHFGPGSRWLVASHSSIKGGWDQVTFWPLPQRPPSVIEGYTHFQRPLAVSPDGEWLASSWSDGSLRLWPLEGGTQKSVRILDDGELSAGTVELVFDASGKLLAGTGWGGQLFIASLDDGSVRRLEGFPAQQMVIRGAAFSPSGRLFAAGTGFSSSEERNELRIWDLDTGEARAFGLDPTRISRDADHDDEVSETPKVATIESLAFTEESTLYSAGHEGLLRWNLEDGSWERLATVEFGHRVWSRMSDDRQRLITWAVPPPDQCGPGVLMPVVLHDLPTGATQNLAIAIQCSDWPVAFDGSLSVYVTGGADGTLRVGRVSGGEPHLLAGHRGAIDQLVISPDLEWIASTGEDQTIRVWPMPDLDKPPLHTLPHEQLIAKLQSFTNLRAVRNPASATGWAIEIGPFPGWAEVPEW